MLATAKSRRSLWIAALCAWAALVLASPAGAAAAIEVRSLDGADLASFDALRCKTVPGVGIGKGFTASAKQGGWRLTVRIYDFRGFHRYPIEYGSEGNVDFFVSRGAGRTFSNVAKPDTGAGPDGPRLTLGGAVAFPGGRGKLGIGFALAYELGDFDSQASVAGRAQCRYGR